MAYQHSDAKRWRADGYGLEGPGSARVVAIAFAVADSNFPLRVGFPLFVSNVIHWLAERRARSEAMLKAGGTFFPKDGEEIRKDPSRKRRPGQNRTAPSSQTPFTVRKMDSTKFADRSVSVG